MAKKTKCSADAPRELYTIKTKGKGKGELVSRLGLGNPITVKAAQIAGLFKLIPDCTTGFDFDSGTISIYVSDSDRADAINYFIQHDIAIGSLALKVKVWDCSKPVPEECGKPTYTVTEAAKINMIKALFKDSPIGPEYTCLVDQFKTKWHFFEFFDICVRYQADSLQNPYGFEAALVLDLVRDLFEFPAGCMLSTYSRP